MQNTIAVALSRMTGQQRAMDVTANNIANASTPGFRAERSVFADFLVRMPSAGLPQGAATITFVQDRATYRDPEPGPIATTGNPLDIAIGGRGFFLVQTARGQRMSRAGHFELSADGGIVDSAGNALLDGSGRPLRLQPTDTQITIAADGTITTENGQAGRVAVVRPENPFSLTPEGGRLFDFEGPPVPIDRPRLVQGALEGSNVVPTLELTRMMRDLREFEFTSQMVQTEGERLRAAIEKLTQKRV